MIHPSQPLAERFTLIATLGRAETYTTTRLGRLRGDWGGVPAPRAASCRMQFVPVRDPGRDLGPRCADQPGHGLVAGY